MFDQNVLFAFSLTLLAGLSTGIGSALAFFTRETNKKALSLSLGFSAGVMVYVSFIEIFPKALERLSLGFPGKTGELFTVLSFFGGILLIGVIDKLVPNFENPHEVRQIEEIRGQITPSRDEDLLRMGIFSAIAIAIHNFPEGLATFTAALTDPNLGVAITVAVAIHNIPEGIAVSIPVYYATKSRKKAFTLSFMSGLSEPVGALIGFLLLRPFMSDTLMGVLFAGVAGIMVYISLDELLPSAEEYGEHHLAIIGVIAGMAVMAASLLLF